MRILHSLPRTHKLLLLPVATMVTVLGTHKILAAFDANDESQKKQVLVSLPIKDVASQGDILNHEAQATSVASLANDNTVGDRELVALDATRQAVPLSSLIAQEVVDISFIESANAAQPGTSGQTIPFAPAKEPGATLPADAQRLDNQALHLAMQLGSGEEAGGTSYNDFSIDPLILNEDGIDLENELVAKEVYVPEWETYTVQAGDTFAIMAERSLGLGYSKVIKLLESLPDKSVLTQWQVGDSFDFKRDKSGDLLALRVMKDARSGYLIEHDLESETFDVAKIEKSGEATQRLFAGNVNGSFAQSAVATGLSYAEVANLSNLLSKKLDFRRDTRRGDRFQVLVESDMIEGKAMDSQILAAHYEGQKMDLTVVRNPADDRFYTPDGHSLDPAFDRYPFNGDYRISSPFNLRRHHPITGRISPHRGTDFATMVGTPVLSPADGRVIKSTHLSLAGNFIVIRHDNGYKTRYMHLSERLVSEGDRVSMGEKIALTGNTGRSTGPHLHYEVIVNNNHVDPMRVKLPEGQSLSGDALAAFKQESEQLLAKLEHDTNGTVVASTNLIERPDDG
ncbi:murein DD-endopeptidase [Modicisalibacter muralis]|uniref:Murein DD-endopeptidase n=1 Tax=Modicisalibacter muralis TaxID=119000 RepID=A0A1G9RTH6_9GAMM|nr:peptidoglycan DD-metalloendopeptidase family protein [Halomonas muralis]SDM26474.1 murein DD-endopeptidase [Halomonas muralis]